MRIEIEFKGVNKYGETIEEWDNLAFTIGLPDYGLKHRDIGIGVLVHDTV